MGYEPNTPLRHSAVDALGRLGRDIGAKFALPIPRVCSAQGGRALAMFRTRVFVGEVWRKESQGRVACRRSSASSTHGLAAMTSA